jgi:hypothetical protein
VIWVKMCQLHLGNAGLLSAGLNSVQKRFEPLDCPAVRSVLEEKPNGTACFKNVNNCLNTNIYSYLETSGGQSSNPFLTLFIFSTPELIRNLWQLKTAVFPASVSITCCSIAWKYFRNRDHWYNVIQRIRTLSN